MNAFWKDRGIVDARDRGLLLEIGLANQQRPGRGHEDSQGYKSKLPGPDVMWTLEARKQEVQIELNKEIDELWCCLSFAPLAEEAARLEMPLESVEGQSVLLQLDKS